MFQISSPPKHCDVTSLLTSSALRCIAAMLKCYGSLGVVIILCTPQGNMHLV